MHWWTHRPPPGYIEINEIEKIWLIYVSINLCRYETLPDRQFTTVPKTTSGISPTVSMVSNKAESDKFLGMDNYIPLMRLLNEDDLERKLRVENEEINQMHKARLRFQFVHSQQCPKSVELGTEMCYPTVS